MIDILTSVWILLVIIVMAYEDWKTRKRMEGLEKRVDELERSINLLEDLIEETSNNVEEK